MSPEGILWTRAFELRGGVVAQIPPGLSWLGLQRRADSAKAWIARHGASHIAPELRALVLTGRVNLAAARLPKVWIALADLGGWRTVSELRGVLDIRHESLTRALGMLAALGRAEYELVGRVRHVRSGERHDTLVYRARGARAPDLSELPDAA